MYLKKTPSPDACIDYVGLRPLALPFHLPRGFEDRGADEELRCDHFPNIPQLSVIITKKSNLFFPRTERRFDIASSANGGADNASAVFVERRPRQV